MISDDNYTLELEAILLEEGGFHQVRAIAENVVKRSTVETQLSAEQATSILEQVYDGDILISAIEQLATGYPSVLLSAAKARCILTSQDLMRFGFDHADLKKLSHGLS
jgi:hypothetical protein